MNMKFFQVGVPNSLFDEMEEKYAPPDHDVFHLTPPPFDSRANKYYEEMGQPPVSSNSFWNVYQQLLSLFWGAELSDDLTKVLSDLENHTEQIAKEKADVLPGLKPLRLGATVVGDGFIDGDESELEVSMTESDSGEEAGSSSIGHTRSRIFSAPTFSASMTPSKVTIGPTHNRNHNDRTTHRTHRTHTSLHT